VVGRLVPDFVVEIWPVEGGLEKNEVFQIEDVFDVLEDAGCSCGCQAEDGDIGKLPLHYAEVFVIGPKVVAVR